MHIEPRLPREIHLPSSVSRVTGHASGIVVLGKDSWRPVNLNFKRDSLPTGLNLLKQIPDKLPSIIDLRPNASPVADQGQEGSCTAFASVKGLREYLELQALKGESSKFTALSPAYVYYKEREIQGTTSQDSGSTVSNAITVLRTDGVSPEVDDPYVAGNYTTPPSPKAEADASTFKIQSGTQLNTLADVKASLAAGSPVVFGFQVYKSFEGIGADGVMPMPKKGEPIMGGHAVMAAGYDDTRHALIVRNSWGPGWGDHGYFYMPYKFFENPKYASDKWTASA